MPRGKITSLKGIGLVKLQNLMSPRIGLDLDTCKNPMVANMLKCKPHV